MPLPPNTDANQAGVVVLPCVPATACVAITHQLGEQSRHASTNGTRFSLPQHSVLVLIRWKTTRTSAFCRFSGRGQYLPGHKSFQPVGDRQNA